MDFFYDKLLFGVWDTDITKTVILMVAMLVILLVVLFVDYKLKD